MCVRERERDDITKLNILNISQSLALLGNKDHGTTYEVNSFKIHLENILNNYNDIK